MGKILFYIVLLNFSLAFSQSQIDSLEALLPTLKNDSLKVRIYEDLGLAYTRRDQEKALFYFIKAEELSKKSGFKVFWAKAKYRKATVYRNMNRSEIAKAELDTALTIFSNLNDLKGIVLVKMELATLLKEQYQFEDAITLYLEALTLNKKLGDTNAEARIHNLIGGIYKSQKHYDKAIEHYAIGLELVKELNFKPGISTFLSNSASIYIEINSYDKAKPLLLDALKIKKETGDKLGTARVLLNLATIYNNEKKYDDAESYYQEALTLAKEVNNIELITLLEYGLAECSYYKGDFKRTIEQANLVLAKLNPKKNKELSIKAYNLLSSAYRALNDYQKALEYAVMKNKLSDSLYNEKLVLITNDLEAKYQNEQKVKENALLIKGNDLQALKLKQRSNERNVIIAFAFILLLIGFLLYNQYRIKQKANVKLQELDKLKSNFFTNISHEFRTPLTLIKGPIEQLEQNPDESLSRENVKMIRRNANRLLKLVNQLLDLSKIDEGSLQLEPTEGDVFKCLRTAASSFNSHAAQHQIDYKINIPQSSLWASFDRDKLEKIMYNLLSNAFKFSDDGATIRCDVTFNNHDLYLEVSDSGKGIAEEEIPFIFNRFYQIDSSHTKEKEGTGIGLSLIKELIELMDGTITVTSEIDKGTFFSVLLPIQSIKIGEINVLNEPSVQAGFSTQPTLLPLGKADSRNLPEVLLIEDNEDMRHYIRENLLSLYRVSEANNGALGLKIAINKPPDLIISDVMMPKMDGLELCTRLKTNVNTSHIPIIMLTAKAGLSNKIEGLETGADDYLTKPFNVKELLTRIKNLIEQRKKLRNLFTQNITHIDPKKITVTSIDQKFIEKVIVLLEENYSESEFGVPQMQVQLAMSKTQLHRKLKALTNEAPGELLRHFRLKRAAQLLSEDADNVTQIAYQVGFNNLSYFAKCFKELYGVAPSAFQMLEKQQ